MGEWTNRTIKIKEKLSKKVMLYSLVVFILSIILFEISNYELIYILAAFAIIISGAVIALFIVVYFILRLIDSINRNKKQETTTKKISKSTLKKMPVKKKAVSRKKTIAKKVPKKIISKKRK